MSISSPGLAQESGEVSLLHKLPYLHLDLSLPGNLKGPEEGLFVFEPNQPLTVSADYFDRAEQEFTGDLAKIYISWGDGTYDILDSESDSVTHTYAETEGIRKTCYWLDVIAVVDNGHTRNYLISQNQLGEWWFEDSQKADQYHREAPLPEIGDEAVRSLMKSLRESRHPLGRCTDDPLYEEDESDEEGN